MSQMIGIIDYGMGNLRSVEKAFAFLGHEAFISDDFSRLRGARGLVLPGVGAFGDAMQELEMRRLVDPILQWVGEGKPFLGICLGCQLLFDGSEESPRSRGLGIIPGSVERFPDSVKIPHIGWNDIIFKRENPILAGVPQGSFVYFVHSYYVKPESEETVLTTTDYGSDFVSGVQKGNLVGFQFHPEKSSRAGLKMLENFADLCARGEG